VCWLRCGRKLEAGMVITVEPGCYFNDKWLDRALALPQQAKYINASVLAGYRGSGNHFAPLTPPNPLSLTPCPPSSSSSSYLDAHSSCAVVCCDTVNTGGCRLEDDVAITATGIVNLTVLPTRYTYSLDSFPPFIYIIVIIVF
jgi:Xaa-Pro aminopeptidase